MVLIFDYDGTLHNTSRLYGKAFRKGYQWMVDGGYAEDVYHSDEEMSKWLGFNPIDMWDSFAPGLDPDVRRTVSDMVGRNMVDGVLGGEAELFEHVPEVLEELRRKGHKTVILSNCRETYMEAHRKAFGLEKWFDGFYPAQKYGYIPKEEIFKSIEKDFPGENFTVIGDRASDIRAGTANGVPTVGCAYGFGEPEELEDCDYVISDITELPDVIDKIEDKALKKISAKPPIV